MKININTGKPNTPAYIIMTMPVCIIVMFLMFGCALWQGLIQKSFDFWFWFSVSGGVVLWLYGDICDRVFNYYENAWVEFGEKSIVYGYNLNSRVLATSDTSCRITINEISSFKVRHGYIKIRGTMTKKAPLRKVKLIKECRIMLDKEKRMEIIESVKSFAGKGNK